MKFTPIKSGFIYIITNKLNSKTYIGKSTNQSLDTLIARYKHEIKDNRDRLIIRALKKHGLNSFSFQILENNIPEPLLSPLEMAYISFYQSYNSTLGYNATRGGEGSIGLKWSEESRAKLSRVMKGKYIGAANPFFGKRHSQEVINKVIASNKKRKGSTHRPHTEESKKKMSLNRIGKPAWNKGREYPQIRGVNNTNYKRINVEVLKTMLINKEKRITICKKLDIGESCFYRKIKEHKLQNYYA